MLSLIGIGLADPTDITLKGLELVKSAKKVYLENYTSFLSCGKSDLELAYGKPIELANRTFVEDARQLLNEASKEDVALLIIGDPLCATTHWDILMRAKERSIQTQVVHNASIMSAIGATGLQVYKFGKTTSMPFPSEKFQPQTAYQAIKENKSIGAHTLVLLDLDPEKNHFLSASQAIEILRSIERERKEKVVLQTDWCIGIARLGFANQKISAGSVHDIAEVDFGTAPQALIFPGKLHFLEEEALETFRYL